MNQKNQRLHKVAFILLHLSGLQLSRVIRKCNQIKKLNYFSKPPQRKLLIILSLTRLRHRVKDGSPDHYFQDDGYSNNANIYHSTTPEQYFRQQYFKNFDLIISPINPFRSAKAPLNGNHRLKIMSKIETTSKVSLKLTSRVNLGRRGARAKLSTLDTALNPKPLRP